MVHVSLKQLFLSAVLLFCASISNNAQCAARSCLRSPWSQPMASHATVVRSSVTYLEDSKTTDYLIRQVGDIKRSLLAQLHEAPAFSDESLPVIEEKIGTMEVKMEGLGEQLRCVLKKISVVADAQAMGECAVEQLDDLSQQVKELTVLVAALVAQQRVSSQPTE